MEGLKNSVLCGLDISTCHLKEFRGTFMGLLGEYDEVDDRLMKFSSALYQYDFYYKESSIHMVCFNQDLALGDAQKKLEVFYRPAKLEDLCILGLQAPDLLAKYTMVALGGKIDDLYFTLRQDKGLRKLGLSFADDVWGKTTRYIAFDK